MYVFEAGDAHAPPILLLHGGGVAGWMWRPALERLATTARVIIPDLPGHGRSTAGAYRSHEETTQALARVLEERAPQGAMVAGFSLGAQLTILLAATRPDLVAGAVVVSAQARPLRSPRATLGLLAATAPLARQPWFAKLQARQLFIPDELLTDYLRDSAGMSRETLLAAVGENIRFTLPAGWAGFENPVLILVGGQERKLMHDSARDIHGSLPGSRLTVVPECGHGIPLQRPKLFAQILADRM
ncbi:alpha/beta hydrolase [Spongiactinospora sp. TRM90649]|uniref:alpha/beta fold hydrolase n=1 Tax=Spongiactinospora sp. TRM90649 TaxID=3031114 RepID=UPI0023F7AD56|nr:alpha/beta hydrolase [Spongiactinospora sp. TRM90649]MDF5757649.1 alpha/beta hydrolase [Spongiactinospora sp. TRM90649]